jgi:hypothetical protein
MPDYLRSREGKCSKLHTSHLVTMSAYLEMASTSLPALTPGGPSNHDILDSTGHCLLSLDGGGVRGLASLYILQRTMKELNFRRKARGLGPKKPCEIFDLMGGTSTGGYALPAPFCATRIKAIQTNRNHVGSIADVGRRLHHCLHQAHQADLREAREPINHELSGAC